MRKYIEAKYGAKALYENGLTVRTSLDAELQRAANRAVDHGLRQVARRRGVWRKPARNVLTEGHTLEAFQHDRWSRPMAAGDIVPAVVMAVERPRQRARRPRGCGSARYTADLGRSGLSVDAAHAPRGSRQPGDLDRGRRHRRWTNRARRR